MSAQEVCLIIRESAKQGVSKLKFAGLELELGQRAPSPFLVPAPLGRPTPAAEMAVPNHEAQSHEALEMDELQLRERQIEELLLTDPLAAEELIRQGELEEDGSIESE